MTDNIILIGMPGCGKSTAGVLLAKTLAKSFCDTDLLLQKSQGMALYRMLEEEGIERFIALENALVSELEVNSTVVATGGSVIYGKEAMSRLKALGTVVYLYLGIEEIERRINNISTRGVVMHEGQTLAQIYAERTPLYEKYADVTVSCVDKSLEETVLAVAAACGYR